MKKKKKKEIEKWVPHMPAPCSLLWFYKKMVGRMEPRQTYYIFYILIPKSVLLLLSIGSSLFDDFDLVRNLPTSTVARAAVGLLTFHTWVILAPSCIYVFQTLKIPEPFPVPRCLADSLAWSKEVEQYQRSPSAVWKKKTFVSIKN